ncbi:MAG: VOC family protein [Methanothrix sp.]|nr:VOC family protein [Methanothrix sp.]
MKAVRETFDNIYLVIENVLVMKNVVSWFDIPTEDFDRAVRFYSAILGKEIRVDFFMGQKYGFFPMDGREGVGGDIVPPEMGNKPSANGTRVYLSCEGVLDEVIARVEKAGGKIVMPRTKIGDAGWVALITDSEGNIVGLHSFK